MTFGFVINSYFRSGAPPVINPLYTRFPRDTAVPGSFAVTLTWTLPNRTTGAFNVTSPLPGDWFLAAHLPKDEGKISVKVSLNNYHKSTVSSVATLVTLLCPAIVRGPDLFIHTCSLSWFTVRLKHYLQLCTVGECSHNLHLSLLTQFWTLAC